MRSWNMRSQQSYSELAAELKKIALYRAMKKLQAKLGNEPTVELLLACCEVRTELAAKLDVSFLGFIQKASLGSLSASLNQ